jgi:hypothetical protein
MVCLCAQAKTVSHIHDVTTDPYWPATAVCAVGALGASFERARARRRSMQPPRTQSSGGEAEDRASRQKREPPINRWSGAALRTSGRQRERDSRRNRYKGVRPQTRPRNQQKRESSRNDDSHPAH